MPHAGWKSGDRKAIFSIWHLKIRNGALANQWEQYCHVVVVVIVVVSDRQLDIMMSFALRHRSARYDILKYVIDDGNSWRDPSVVPPRVNENSCSRRSTVAFVPRAVAPNRIFCSLIQFHRRHMQLEAGLLLRHNDALLQRPIVRGTLDARRCSQERFK